MKNIIKYNLHNIIKEEISDFDVVGESPLDIFEKYFYQSRMSRFIVRDVDWWLEWIDDVRGAHTSTLDDLDELKDMLTELVNADSGDKKYKSIAKSVKSFLEPMRELRGLSLLEYSAHKINEAYEYLGDFCEKNNLPLLDVLNLFEQWLEKLNYDTESIHKK